MTEEKHPFTEKVFPIPWAELTPEAARTDILRAIKRAEEKIESISSLADDQLSYDSVFKALDNVDIEVEYGSTLLEHLTSVHDNEPLRVVHKELEPKTTDFYTQLTLNSRLWAVVKKCAKLLETDNTLSQTQRRFIESTLLNFRLSGADLDEEKKKEFAQINVDIAKLTTDYQQNVLDSTNAYELYIDDPKELEGLPESSLNMAKEEATKKGHPDKHLFTLHFPSFFPVMKYAKSDNIRKTLYEANLTIGKSGKFDNTDIVFKVSQLRHRKAQLLGFKSHADLTLKRRMAENGDNALKFVEDLFHKAKNQFEEECETLRLYKAKILNKKGDEEKEVEILPWDSRYYGELLRQEQYDFDDESLRPYFPLDEVMKGVFRITSTLYGINVVEHPTFCKQASDTADSNSNHEGKVEVWHEDVKFFDVFDKETGEQIGSFFADWHPRSDKKSGAWMNPLYSLHGTNPKSLGVICGNLQKPSGGKPALLDHGEVETIFHEFGHLCHHIVSKTDIRAFAGTNVAWDFVELPSQFLENWTWEKEALDLFAHHIETKEPIPQVIYDKMKAAKNFNIANYIVRQLSFGRIDLELHHHFENCQGKTIDEIDQEVLKEYRVKCSIPPKSILYSFGHIFGSSVGYSAGYYSYMWAEVLEADAFTRFKKEGILNEKVGKEFRDKILIWGDSKPAGDLFKDFMGRDPDPTALLIRDGIKF